MKTDYISCKYCGCVFDVEILKAQRENKTRDLQEDEDYRGLSNYNDYYDFEHARCPCCKQINQR